MLPQKSRYGRCSKALSMEANMVFMHGIETKKESRSVELKLGCIRRLILHPAFSTITS